MRNWRRERKGNRSGAHNSVPPGRRLGGSISWVRLSKWRDIRAREERVEALLELWNSDVSAAKSDPCSFSSAFEVLGTCADELHEAVDGVCDDDYY